MSTYPQLKNRIALCLILLLSYSSEWGCRNLCTCCINNPIHMYGIDFQLQRFAMCEHILIFYSYPSLHSQYNNCWAYIPEMFAGPMLVPTLFAVERICITDGQGLVPVTLIEMIAEHCTYVWPLRLSPLVERGYVHFLYRKLHKC